MEDSCWEMRLRCGRVFSFYCHQFTLQYWTFPCFLIFLMKFIVLVFAYDKGMLLHLINFQKKRSIAHSFGDKTPLLHANFGTNAQFLRHRVIISNECAGKIQRLFQFMIFTMQFLYLISVMTLFMMSVEVRSPLIMETITVPCLKILLRLVKPPPPSSKTNKVRTCVPSLWCGQIDTP